MLHVPNLTNSTKSILVLRIWHHFISKEAQNHFCKTFVPYRSHSFLGNFKVTFLLRGRLSLVAKEPFDMRWSQNWSITFLSIHEAQISLFGETKPDLLKQWGQFKNIQVSHGQWHLPFDIIVQKHFPRWGITFCCGTIIHVRLAFQCSKILSVTK